MGKGGGVIGSCLWEDLDSFLSRSLKTLLGRDRLQSQEIIQLISGVRKSYRSTVLAT